MTDFDDRGLDVDFTKDPHYVFGDLGARTFNCPSYEQRFGTLSDAEIEEAIDAADEAGGSLDLLVSRIMDQRQEGSCASNATAQAVEVIQCKEHGRDGVILVSPISLYKRVARSAQSGSVISDNWDELNKRGILPLDTPENRSSFGEHVMPHTGFNTPFPRGWEATAARLKGLEAWPISTVAGMHSAWAKGHPIVVGRDGHAIVYLRLMRDSRRRRVYRYANSWSPEWSDNGFGYDSESKFAESARWAFALRAMRGRQ